VSLPVVGGKTKRCVPTVKGFLEEPPCLAFLPVAKAVNAEDHIDQREPSQAANVERITPRELDPL
jgi:hypothetical protein